MKNYCEREGVKSMSMTEKIIIKGVNRSNFGKGQSRKLRGNLQIPAVIYSKDASQTIHISLPKLEFVRSLKNRNVLISLHIEENVHTVLVKNIQKNVVTRDIEHVDLLKINKGDEVCVSVDIHIEGEAAPGTNTSLVHPRVSIYADGFNIPRFLVLNIQDRKAGNHAVAADIDLPKNTRLAIDGKQLIVNISAQRTVAVEPEAK